MVSAAEHVVGSHITWMAQQESATTANKTTEKSHC